MKILVVVNDQPYGSERPFNALRLADALVKREEVGLRVFLVGTPLPAPSRVSSFRRTTSTAC